MSRYNPYQIKPLDIAPYGNVIDDGILISDFEDLTLWTASGNGTLTADTVNKLDGTQGGKRNLTNCNGQGIN